MVRDNGDKVLEVWLSHQRHLRPVGHRSMSPKSKSGQDLSSHEDRRCRGEVGGVK